MQSQSHLEHLPKIAQEDVAVLQVKEKEYGSSWKRRGGVGAFMMLARKWDRIEEQVKRVGWDVFDAAKKDARKEGILDDIGDLRRYLLLVEAEIQSQQDLSELMRETFGHTNTINTPRNPPPSYEN